MPNWTLATGCCVEANTHTWTTAHIVAGRPFDTRLPLGTHGNFPLPINGKGMQIIACSSAPLATVGPEGWPDHINLMVHLGDDEELRRQVATIQEVRRWEQLAIHQRLLDGWPHPTIRCTRRRGRDLRDEIRAPGIAGFAEMDFIANPRRLPFTPIAGVEVVGRLNQQRGWWLVLARAPADRLCSRMRTAIELLNPDLPKDLQRGQRAQRVMGRQREDSGQQRIPIGGDVLPSASRLVAPFGSRERSARNP